MSLFLDIGRPIFLHFLNRHASLAARHELTEANDVAAIDTLTICHCNRLSTNISQMVEYSYEKNSLASVLGKLVEKRIIVTTSNDPDIDTFLDSRQRLYQNVAQDFPMYFSNESYVRNLKIWENNTFSMTKELRQSILNVDQNELALFGERARQNDKETLLKNLSTVQNVVYNHQEAAITQENLNFYLNNGDINGAELRAIGRIYSALYFEHYSHHNQVVTPTGLQSTGYLEDTRYFPLYDVQVLAKALNSLGWKELAIPQESVRDQMLATYGSPEHRVFAETLAAYLHACDSEVRAYLNAPEDVPVGFGEASSIATRRSLIVSSFDHSIRNARSSNRKTAGNVVDFFKIASDFLLRAASVHVEANINFKLAWEANMPPKTLTRFLFMTATDKEDHAIEDAILSNGFHLDAAIPVGRAYANRYCLGTTNEIIHVRSSAGSVGASGSELVSSDAINAIDPEFVVAVGICFGLKEDKHSVSDILVSDAVADYELVRQGDKETRERGPNVPAGPRLLSAARMLANGYRTSTVDVHIGLLLSGLKLVDSKKMGDDLKQRFPDAIGGEMEASGVLAAASRSGREWIVVKAICDWAVNKGDDDQDSAATNSSAFSVKLAKFVMDAEARRRK
jgi:nucleoside phosphorylase